jgi:manganese/zinc/iron transport system permease protein
MNEVLRVLLLQDYNTRLVVVGTAMLGAAAGMAGTFLMLRKRALLGDAVAHATLPGVVLTFILLALTGGNPRSLPWLMGGAAVFGTLGMLTVVLIRRWSKLKDDSALGIVLSVYFGFGVCLLGVASRLEGVNAAGLSSFIYGKTASMLFVDALLIGGVAAANAAVIGIFFKELKLLCFDKGFAASQGLPVFALDVLLMGLIVAATVIGLQSVGLILVVALLVIPPAAARCWSHRLHIVLWLSALFGALSGLVGSALSALASNMPAGAIIVLVAAGFFLVSLLFGTERGIIWRLLRRWRLEREVGLQHLLRAVWELAEKDASGGALTEQKVSIRRVMAIRSWSTNALDALIRRAVREDLVVMGSNSLRLTARGERAAARHVRNHRLWEIFLIHHADTAPSRVDRGADLIEHVLDEELVAELEAALAADGGVPAIPASPHRVVAP